MSVAKTVLFDFQTPSRGRVRIPAITEKCRFLVKRFISLRTLLVAALYAAGLGTSSAYAHEAGDWLIRLGVTDVSPKSNNGSVLDGAVNLDVSGNVRPSFTIAYMATQHIGIELLGVWPYRHNIRGSGGLGKIGTTEQLPPTLSLQWHFLPDSAVQPYVGVGLNYTHFFDTQTQGALNGSDLELSDSWGLAGQVGVDIKLDDRWFLNADLRHIDISTKVRLDGQRIGTARIDPWVTTVGIGYHF